MSQIVPESSKKAGNTKLPSKQISPAKKWVFTLNNYTEEQINILKGLDSSIVPKLVFLSEVGESATPHLQGVLHFLTKKRPSGFVGIKEIHYEKQRGTDREAFEYACKNDTHDGKVKYLRGYKPIQPIKTFPPRGWLEQVIKHLDEPIDDRKIMWFWNTDGNIGKTTICKYVMVNYENTIYLGGKGADMKYSIAEYFKSQGQYPENILINIPKNSGIDYGALEEIKDALFFSGKYESLSILGNHPRIIIFANHRPEDDLNGRIVEIDLNERMCSTHITPGGSEGSNVLEQINVMNTCFADWATPRPVAPSVLHLSNTTV